jgi:hypothetical protein
MLRHTLPPGLTRRGVLRSSLRPCSVRRFSFKSSLAIGPGFKRNYSTDTDAIELKGVASEEPVRPEHAVISTFDLFSIGGELGSTLSAHVSETIMSWPFELAHSGTNASCPHFYL